MNDINWDLAPEGAVAVGQRFGGLAFINAAGLAYIGDDWVVSSGWNIIATRPQPEKKPRTHTFSIGDKVKRIEGAFQGMKIGDVGTVSELSDPNGICLKEYQKTHAAFNFELVKEQHKTVAKSEPEWTHEYRLGNSQYWFPCSIVTEVGTQGVVIKCDVFEGVQYCSFNSNQPIQLKPIKHIITEKERELVAKFVAQIFTKVNPDLRKEFDDFINNYEVKK